jgi:hypothetical protein
VAQRIAEAEAGEDGVDLVLVSPASQAVELGGEGVVAVEQGGALGFRPMLERGEGVFGNAQVGLDGMERREHVVERLLHRLAAGQLGELREVADPDAGRDRDAALVGRDLAEDDAQEGGLAGTVAADEADALAGGEAEVHVAEDRPVVVPHRDVLQQDQAHDSGLLRLRSGLQPPSPQRRTTKKRRAESSSRPTTGGQVARSGPARVSQPSTRRGRRS